MLAFAFESIFILNHGKVELNGNVGIFNQSVDHLAKIVAPSNMNIDS